MSERKDPRDFKKVSDLSEMNLHWNIVRSLDGKRPILQAYGCVNYGGVQYPDEYVINGYLDERVRNRIKSKGYPIRIKKYSESSLNKPSERWEQEAKDVLGTEEVLLLLLPDITAESGWSLEYVAISDLMVDDSSILEDEAFAALESGEERLASCKGQAYLATIAYYDDGE